MSCLGETPRRFSEPCDEIRGKIAQILQLIQVKRGLVPVELDIAYSEATKYIEMADDQFKLLKEAA